MAQRKYAMSDAILLETADTITGYLIADINQFNTFDPAAFPVTLPDTIKQKVTDAFNEGGDDIGKTELSVKTDIVYQEIQNCKRFLDDLKYWAKKTFTDHPAIQKQFGVNRIGDIFASQPGLIQFMESLPQVIATHRTQLDATGTPAQLLDQAASLAKALRDANTAQENQKGNRMITTESRVIHLNKLYDILKKLDDAAASIYRDQPTKRILYKVTKTNNTQSQQSDSGIF
ncbi:hypothetical protein [Aquimarina sediminis]|uniref:hypothetical protein n=1 Tax=Aquimarina sediminis TaxID=2070536 RepID=UPI000CA017E7|nr:hypothetical protein [Aquimarina sediminis]